jgi:iron complex outermembrane receptor protein
VQVRGGEIRTITRFRNSLRKKVRIESLRVNYSYLDATLMNMDKESKYALQHLRHQIVAGIDVLTTESFSHSINMRYNERFNGLEYGLVDYRVRFNRNNWSIFGDINNLLDREYIESGVVPMPGRWYRIGVEYRLR